MKKCIGQPCRVCNTLITEETATRDRRCKPCYNAHMREYFQKYKDKHRKIMYNWRAQNKDKVKQMLVNHAEKRFGSLSKQASYYGKIYKEHLTDTYVKFTLCRHSNGALPFKDIPQDLVDLKRKQLLLIRQLKANNSVL